MRSIRKWGVGRVRRLAQRWGSAAEAAGLLAFSLTGPGTSTPPAPNDSYGYSYIYTYQVSFHADDNALYVYTANGSKSPITLDMQADTSPASAQLSDGTFESAFQSKGNDLYLYNWTGAEIRTTLRMDSGTSPALAGLPVGTGWIAAFQDSNNHLDIDTSAGGNIDTGLRIKPGTSPAIAMQPDGDWEVAFTGNDGRLTTCDANGNISRTTDAMDTASSPSIAALANGSYQVAFEAKNDYLDIYHADDITDHIDGTSDHADSTTEHAEGTTDHTNLRMDPGTSPSIASQPDGDWEVAFQARNNKLGTAYPAGDSLEITDDMRAGTSPSVTPEPDGSYQVAFEAKNDYLDIYRTGGTTEHTGGTEHTGFRMDPGTSPSAAITAPTPPAMSSPGYKIVSIAESQVGYQDHPLGSYCNPYSAYWNAGSSCSHGNNDSEEWCADFAAWVWRQAGVPFTYGFDTGDINAGAVSVYQWGVANGTWHAAGSGYTPQPGDLVIYGLDIADTTADHVGIVIGGTAADPDVVNGDWWSSGNGAVVAVTDETTATGTDKISGYISPWRTPSSVEGYGRHRPVRRAGQPRAHG
jgi:hypothetical protein